MKQRFPPNRPALPLPVPLAAAWVHIRLHQLHELCERARSGPDSDRGANVVETIMIVAGFASIAALIVLMVKAKVTNWIAQIPGGGK